MAWKAREIVCDDHHDDHDDVDEDNDADQARASDHDRLCLVKRVEICYTICYTKTPEAAHQKNWGVNDFKQLIVVEIGEMLSPTPTIHHEVFLILNKLL